MEILVLLAGILAVIFFIYKGYNTLYVAPMVLAITFLILEGLSGVVPVIAEVYLTTFGSFILRNFPIFLLGSIFGEVMKQSLLASDIAKTFIKRLGTHYVLLIIILTISVLIYAGISVFVVFFCIYPISNVMLEEVGLPKRFTVLAMAVAMPTFMLTSMPGTPQIQNILVSEYLGTTIYAGAWFGLASTAFSFTLLYTYVMREAKKARSNQLPKSFSALEVRTNAYLAFLPIILIILGNFVFIQGKLIAEPYRNIYGISSSLILSTAYVIIIYGRKFDVKSALNTGAVQSIIPLTVTAAMIAFGTSLSQAVVMQDVLTFALNHLHPLVSLTSIIAFFSAVTGSATGGLTIGFNMILADTLPLIDALGLNREILHRLVLLASGTFDTLPNNGTFLTMLLVLGLTFKETYKDYFILTVLIPLITFLLGLGFVFIFII